MKLISTLVLAAANGLFTPVVSQDKDSWENNKEVDLLFVDQPVGNVKDEEDTASTNLQYVDPPGYFGIPLSRNSNKWSSDEQTESKLDGRPEHIIKGALMHLRGFEKIQGMMMKSNNKVSGIDRCNDNKGMTEQGKLSCYKIDQHSYITNAQLGSQAATKYTIDCDGEPPPPEGLEDPCEEGFDWISDLWGWVSPTTNKRYALAKVWDGISFLDITDTTHPIVLGFMDSNVTIPVGVPDGYWGDHKIVDNVVYIGAEWEGNGIQIYDLKQLDDLPRPTNDPPLERGKVHRIQPDNWLSSIGHTHNIVAFPELGKVLAVGIGFYDDNTACDWSVGDTVIVLDVASDPINPPISCLNIGSEINTQDIEPYAQFNSNSGYIHDAHCFVYKGPDTKYYSVPMCVFFAETEIGIYNMDSLEFINIFGYHSATYVHQGWVSDDFTTIYANDEFDEECQSGLLEDYVPLCHENYPNGIAHTNTYIFDITSLEDVGPPRIFTNTNAHPAVDHNMYVHDNLIYSASYNAGARIFEIQEDMSLDEIAHFDMNTDCDDIINCFDYMSGTWTHYFYEGTSISIAGDGYYGLYILGSRLDEPNCNDYTNRRSCRMSEGCSWERSIDECVAASSSSDSKSSKKGKKSKSKGSKRERQ